MFSVARAGPSRLGHQRKCPRVICSGWQENSWLRYDDLVSQVSVKPRIWVVDVAGSHSKERTNFSVDRLQPSRELTAVGYPIRLSTKIHYASNFVLGGLMVLIIALLVISYHTVKASRVNPVNSLRSE